MANRSEIAVRVIRACREMGIGAVAVYSDADKDAMHVRMADAAVHVGTAPSRDSYLVGERLIAAAKDKGCDAVHPGYGFLSENAAFARAVIKAGLVWIGPPPSAMDAMGSKVTARAHAQAAGVPVAAGSVALRDAAVAKQEAKRIGYPVILKAAHGGGGIGMRVVRTSDHLESQFAAATAQAEAAFGSSEVFLEKYLERPRHIEVQILADAHGNVIHLGERECSIQRRHQKLVEEAPSPALSAPQRAELGEMAVALAKRVGYQGAGTMEFLYEPPVPNGRHTKTPGKVRGTFAFNEMNTRLQVEHPVTELVTGIDIVQWQLRIAAGEVLSIRQEDVVLRGHAFEARINAEEPARGFAPSPGPVARLTVPSGPGVRVDTALYEGWTVPSDYDSLVMKLVTHAPDRETNCGRMLRALSELQVGGFSTNRDFHRLLFSHPQFRAGNLTTRFLEEHGVAEVLVRAARVRAAAVAAALESFPGGLAAMKTRNSGPAIVTAGGRRDWGTE